MTRRITGYLFAVAALIVALCFGLYGMAFAEEQASVSDDAVSSDESGDLPSDYSFADDDEEVDGISLLSTSNASDYLVEGETNVYRIPSPDDTAAIQVCLNVARTATEPITVRIGAGTYYCADFGNNNKLSIFSNTTLILEDGCTLYRGAKDGSNDAYYVGHNGLLYNFGITETGSASRSLFGGYDMSHDITIKGEGTATINGGNIKTSGLTGSDGHDLVRIDHAQNVTISNINFKNCYMNHHLEFVGVKNGVISGCTFSGWRCAVGHENDWSWGREALELDACWTNNPSDKTDTSSYWASYNITNGDPDKCVDGTPCRDITVTGCSFTNMPSGVGEHHWSSSKSYKNSSNIKIVNNKFSTASSMKYLKYAINTGGLDSCTVSGNTITGPYRYGVYVQHGSKANVSSNTIKGISRMGIMVGDAAKSVTIANNAISNISYNAISALGDSSASTITKLSGNKIGKVGSKKYAVYIGKGVTVSSLYKNTISSTCRYGIYVASKGKVKSLSSNKINKGAKYGIYAASKSYVYSMYGNNVYKTTKYGIYCGSKSVKTKVTKNTIKVKKKSWGIKKASGVKITKKSNKISKYK